MSNGSEHIPERTREPVNIPDEVLRAMDAADHEVYERTNDDREAAMAGYRVIAEWARKEALREAADIAEGHVRRGRYSPARAEKCADIAADIRALVGGDKTDD